MLHPWTTTASHIVIDEPWLRLRADTCVRHDGHVIAPYYVLELRSFVHVIPVLADGRIVVVRQYRPGARTFCLELPGGMLDAGESLLAGAQREAREECGLTGGIWEEAFSCWNDPARCTNRFHAFLARDIEATLAPSFDENEQLEVLRLTPPEIDAAIADGTFSLGHHIAAYLSVRSRLD